MKKLLFVIFMMMFPLLGMAQTSQHMKFLGIPMQGTGEQFGDKLLAKGFTWEFKMHDFMMTMEGRLAGNLGTLHIEADYEYEVGVLGVKFFYECFSRSEGEEKLMQYKKILDSKYTSIHSPFSNRFVYDCQYGGIVLSSIQENRLDDDTCVKYTICVWYYDKKNIDLYNYRKKNGLGKNSDL